MSMVSFNSKKEFREALIKVNSCSSLERKQYEESKGYKSFGRICDELYSNLNPEEFMSIEEIKTFVNANSEYFQILEDKNGELTLEMLLFRNPYRYFLNKERMFKVEKTVFKIFDDVTVTTNEQNINKLRSMNKSNIGLFKSDQNFSFNSSNSTNASSPQKIARDYPPYPVDFCGTEFYGEAVDGRDKTKLWLTFNRTDPYYIIYTSLTIQPYKKTLGVWIKCSRTISYDIKYATDLYIDGTWSRVIHYPLACAGKDSPIGWLNEVESPSSGSATDYHFGAYDGWGRTPSAPVIYLSCTPSLLN